MSDDLNLDAGGGAAIDGLTQHVKRSSHRILSRQEEAALARRARVGDKHAFDTLVTHNIRLVTSIARRYQGHGVPFDDLIQEGTLGLIHAIEKFDPDRGFKLSTYATWWIRQQLQRATWSEDRTIRLPAHAAERVAKIRRAENQLALKLGRTPTAEEIAAAAKLKLADVHHLRLMSDGVSSLDATYGDADLAVQAWAVADDDIEAEAMEADTVRELHEALHLLPAQDRQVLEMRYGLNGLHEHTLDECGRVVGVTRERIRQIQERALRNLRGITGWKAA